MPVTRILAGCKLAAIALIMVLSGSVGLADENRPNFIVFIADDVSWNDYGCYGNPHARTPHIDQLASGGLRFTNAFLTASSCSPSRASMITGRYPHNNGKAAELHLPIASHLTWFPECLRDAGYYTALVGKNHMQREKPDSDNGTSRKVFDLINNGQLKNNHGAEGKWVETVKNRPKDRPFFFWFAAVDAHRGWDADREWKPEYGPMHQPTAVVVPPYLVDDLDTRKDLASYYNEVTRFDFYIGQVISALEQEGQLDNTVILILADNGRPFPRAKTRLHDSGMKTALVVHWPRGITSRGVEVSGLVSAIDIAPTLLEVAGVALPETFQGVSFSPMLQNPTHEIRRYVFSEHNWHDYEAHGRAVRDQFGHLFIVNSRNQFAWQGPADSVRSPSHQSLLRRAGSAKGLTAAQNDVLMAPRRRLELFDTRSDPLQIDNRIGKPSTLKIESLLKDTLEQWSEETLDSIPEQVSVDSFDRQTGLRKSIKPYRFTTPGSDRNAARTNRSGPR